MNNTSSPHTIREWPRDDRPREKLLLHGEHTLSDSELLAILLRTGCRGQSAIALARAVLARFGSFREMAHTDPSAWFAFKGLGPAKTAQIKAALEIGRRFREQETQRVRPKIRCAADAAALLMPRLRDLKKEVFKILLLNSQSRLIDTVEITAGSVNQAHPITREILHAAMTRFAAAIIAVHNHPSGVVAPSPEDKSFTRNLAQACRVMDIALLDHIIIGDNTFFSFADEGILAE